MRNRTLILVALLVLPFCAGCLSAQQRDDAIDLAVRVATEKAREATLNELEKIDIHQSCREKVADHLSEKAGNLAGDAADKSLPEPSGTGKAIFGILLAGAKLALGAFAGVKV